MKSLLEKASTNLDKYFKDDSDCKQKVRISIANIYNFVLAATNAFSDELYSGIKNLSYFFSGNNFTYGYENDHSWFNFCKKNFGDTYVGTSLYYNALVEGYFDGSSGSKFICGRKIVDAITVGLALMKYIASGEFNLFVKEYCYDQFLHKNGRDIDFEEPFAAKFKEIIEVVVQKFVDLCTTSAVQSLFNKLYEISNTFYWSLDYFMESSFVMERHYFDNKWGFYFRRIDGRAFLETDKFKIFLGDDYDFVRPMLAAYKEEVKFSGRADVDAGEWGWLQADIYSLKDYLLALALCYQDEKGQIYNEGLIKNLKEDVMPKLNKWYKDLQSKYSIKKLTREGHIFVDDLKSKLSDNEYIKYLFVIAIRDFVSDFEKFKGKLGCVNFSNYVDEFVGYMKKFRLDGCGGYFGFRYITKEHNMRVLDEIYDIKKYLNELRKFATQPNTKIEDGRKDVRKNMGAFETVLTAAKKIVLSNFDDDSDAQQGRGWAQERLKYKLT